ncbi:MAG: restriction endonuclease [Acidimicrobiia bacterium]|nr:restriction endonuclease [Acidimicrobiia bacterium]
MPAPPFAKDLLGWRTPSGRTGVATPNTSDAASKQSVTIASAVLALLGIPTKTVAPTNPATPFEEGVRIYLEDSLAGGVVDRDWIVDRGRPVTDFAQYSHLARIQEIINRDQTRTLASELGRDYVIKPDVTVGIQTPTSLFLHASVSCKWTIRSDRVQNIRHEAVILTRHRRARQPHIVAVTAEPLPTRLASIARGTGEIDSVYHVAFEELAEAVRIEGTKEQKATLAELVGQGRLYDFNTLPDVLQF